ncbi:MAG TPA: radical SAM protein [Candidatus Aminicenantes bacterium]|nr:radical SAM protein [Candidatus Aminicenantes bacterium]HRY64326.1 radical SAM protein [Candidatus Aminicenantes bacterium]HRZ71239.1 radical SAM protein [Candidatus Aminicenantes bacterium]
MSRFVSRREVGEYPRLPLKGSLDLTYRCGNDCRHCWLRLAPDAPEGRTELSFDEIRRVAGEARSLGCREWTISGGEPLLRPDFPEIFAELTGQALWYTLNTNGGLITPAIARLLRRRGAKLVALYGSTAAVHDAVTRTPGSFAALERGVAYLREAGAPFTVQVVPMKTNIADYPAMVRLAESWSPSWRLGATWLYLSASGDPRRNRDILAERLDPARVVELDQAYAGSGPAPGDDAACAAAAVAAGGRGLFAACLAGRRDFHIDPQGGLSFCSFVKDAGLRLDLRTMSFAEAWNERLPRLAGAVLPTKAYADGCGACELRSGCRWCPVYAFLEHGDHSARIDYLCAVARETRRARTAWLGTHRRRFRVAGLAVDVEADRPIAADTFDPKFELFRAEADGPPDIVLRHHFALPDLEAFDLGREVYRHPPWAVYRRGASWIYVMIGPDPGDPTVHRVMVFDDGHTRGRIYSPSDEFFRAGRLDSLAMLPSDQLVLARALPAFGGLFVHASAVDMAGRGLVFAGPSEAGKSTIARLIGGRARLLCDDRVVIRRSPGGFRVHGTWNHGEIPTVSPGSAPLRAVFFLRQAAANRLDRVDDPRAVLRDFLPRLVRPLLSADWWERALDLAGEIVRQIPFYDLSFDKSGAIVGALEEFLDGAPRP